MLPENRKQVLKQFIESCSREELYWLYGYLEAGSRPANSENQLLDTTATESPISNFPKKITIVYVTETGNSKKIATELATKAKKNAIQVKLTAAEQYKFTDFPKEEYFFLVTSTHGDGEPPAISKKFYDFIHQTANPNPALKFAILALGDTSYPLFCQTGIDFQKQFLALKGTELLPLEKADVDYEPTAAKWTEQVLHLLNKAGHDTEVKIAADTQTIVKKTTGKKTYFGTVTTNVNLNGRGSKKAIHHIEITVPGIEYLPGDSLGIVPTNDPKTVEEIIALTGTEAGKYVPFKKETDTIYDILLRKANISFLLESTIKKFASIAGLETIPPKQSLLSLLQKFPLKNTEAFEEMVSNLTQLSPRLYTISSSPSAHEGEVHLTVEKDVFYYEGSKYYGLCSNYLSQIQPGNEISFFVQPNRRFRLPDPSKNIILIGEGTGVAPYRSFLYERDFIGATGKNWLFFGDENFTTDFLYQTEWQNWFATGVLNQINLAFSDDNPTQPKIETKLKEQGALLFEWVKQGAYIYLCGNKDRMGPAVENALVEVIKSHGSLSLEDAKKFLHDIEEEGRYEKDLY